MKIKLKEMMAKRGISTKELGRKTGLGYTYIYNVENEKQKGINYDALEAICKALKCSTNKILVIEK